MQRRIEVVGPAPTDRVWGRYHELRAWPGWAPQIRTVKADATTLTPGAQGTVHGPLGLSIDFRILEVDAAARTWSWTVRRLGLVVRMHHDLVELRGGTRAGLTVTGPAVLVAAYGPVARLALRRLVALRNRPARASA